MSDPIKHETEAKPREMTPEQSEAWERYWANPPADAEERARLRKIFMGEEER